MTGTEMKALLVADRSKHYNPTDEERANYLSKATELLEHYEYGVTEDGLNAIFDEWAYNKGWLLELLGKHPGYVSDGYYIKIPATLVKPMNERDYRECIEWIQNEINFQLADKYRLKVGMFDMWEYINITQALEDVRRKMADARHYYGIQCSYNGQTEQELDIEIRRRKEVLRKIENTLEEGFETVRSREGNTVCVPNKEYRKARRFRKALDRLPCATFIEDEDKISTINTLLEGAGAKFQVHTGQKVTKIIGRIVRLVGVDKVVKMTTKRWRDENTGEIHERKYDAGWNMIQAKLGDAINPATYNRDIYISANPIDYWTMSFGNSWGSCHTIDIHGLRGNTGSTYQGCHSAGTESYMLDSASLIVWIACTEEQLAKMGEIGRPPYLQSKFKRAVAYLGEDKIILGRVYPDGRDGGDESIGGQLRQIVQTAIAKCLNCDNMWTVNTGRVYDIIKSEAGAHYPDYSNCSDTSTSYLKRTDGYKNLKPITIGHWAICPSCGEEHEEEGNICCSDCQDGRYVYCERCGQRVLRDRAIYVSDSGHYFCDEECAVACDYVYCVDDEEWHSLYNSYYCEYTEEYYHSDDDAFTTEDGYWFPNEDVANDAGCIFCEDGNVYYSQRHAENAGYIEVTNPATMKSVWVQEDEVSEDSYTGELFMADEHTLTLGEKCYMSMDNAKADGWVFYDDGTAKNENTDETVSVEVA